MPLAILARPTIVVRVLGEAVIRVADQSIGLGTEGLFTFALYVTTRSGERIQKEELLDVFWPDGHDEARRHAMRQMMYRLRKLGIETDDTNEHVFLSRELVESDLLDCINGRSPFVADPRSIRERLSLGPTFSSRAPARFLEWWDGIRARVATQQRWAAQAQMNRARREGRWVDLDSWAQLVLASDSLNEDAILARAESAAMGGSKLAALEILDHYLEDLGDLSDDLGRPAQALRKRIAEKRRPWSGRTVSDVPLVGRSAIMAQLAAAIESAGSHAGTSVTLVGPPGVGKTRLATEAAEYSALNGIRVIQVRTDATGSQQTFGLLREVLQQLLELPGALGLHPAQLQLLRDFTARSEARHPVSSEPLSAAALTAATTELLMSLSESARLVVLLDDAHHADEQSRGVLEPCIRREGLRITWLVTSRNSAGAWLPGSHTVRVGALSQDEAATLATSVLNAMGHPLTGEEAAGIGKRAGGNPLFVKEIAAHRAVHNASDEPIPASLQDIIRLRLSTLGDQYVSLLRAVAVLGNCATLPRTIAASGVPSDVALDVIARLEEDGLLFLDSRTTLGLHECWQQAITDSLPHVAEAALSLRCAQAITQGPLTRLDHEALRRAGQLYARAGAAEQALSCLQLSVDQLLSKGLIAEAESALAECRRLDQGSFSRLSILTRECELLLTRGEVKQVVEITTGIPATAHEAQKRGDELTEWALAVAYRHEALGKTTPELRVSSEQLTEAASCVDAAPFSRHYAAFVGARQCVWFDDQDGIRNFHRVAHQDSGESPPTLALGYLEILFNAELGSREDFLRAHARQCELESSFAPLRHVRMSERYRATGLRMHGLVTEAAILSRETHDASLKQMQPDVAAAAAEFLAFILLDQEAPEIAGRWVDCGLRASSRSSDRLREKGLEHARLRWLWQSGRPQEVVHAMTPRLEHLRTDANVTRRLGEILTWAMATIDSGGDGFELTAILDLAEKDLLAVPPSTVWDYPAEMLLRAMRRTSHPMLAEATNRLVSSRRDRFNRPIAPFFGCLNESGLFEVAAIEPEVLRTL